MGERHIVFKHFVSIAVVAAFIMAAAIASCSTVDSVNEALATEAARPPNSVDAEIVRLEEFNCIAIWEDVWTPGWGGIWCYISKETGK